MNTDLFDILKNISSMRLTNDECVHIINVFFKKNDLNNTDILKHVSETISYISNNNFNNIGPFSPLFLNDIDDCSEYRDFVKYVYTCRSIDFDFLKIFNDFNFIKCKKNYCTFQQSYKETEIYYSIPNINAGNGNNAIEELFKLNKISKEQYLEYQLTGEIKK